MSAVETKNAITLKGSSKMICEYLNYGIHSILYQRGVYPPETFDIEEKFGVTLLMSQDEKVQKFLTAVLSQMQAWLENDKQWVSKIAMVISNVQTKEPVERWEFIVEYDHEQGAGDNVTSDKPLKQVQNEIREVLKQIICTIAILPLLDCICSFDIHIYTTDDCVIPEKWNTTKDAEIVDAQRVQLRSFDTGIHKMNTYVSYKMAF